MKARKKKISSIMKAFGFITIYSEAVYRVQSMDD